MHKGFLATERQNATVKTLEPTLTPTEEREYIKVVLMGSPKAVQQTIRVLYLRGFAQVWEWSPLQPTQKAGEVMSLLKRQV
ncbi:MAG: peptide ABC transporter substrate-binding protein [Cyanobacteria bacterium J06592_8]